MMGMDNYSCVFGMSRLVWYIPVGERVRRTTVGRLRTTNDPGKRVAAIRSAQTGTLEEKKIRNEQIPADQQPGEPGK